MIVHLIQEIFNNPVASLILISNLVFIETILSVDNAAVLATMVLHLPKHQQAKALQYGILGAYFFRVIAFYFASYLLKFWWLKFSGGLYLFLLFIKWWKRDQSIQMDEHTVKNNTLIMRLLNRYFGVFSSTIIMVEFMDLIFSIDNIFAIASFSTNWILLLLGSFIGILLIRFATNGFISLIEKHPAFVKAAYSVILLLSIKLMSVLITHIYPNNLICKFIESQFFEHFFTGITLLIFTFAFLIIYLGKKGFLKK